MPTDKQVFDKCTAKERLEKAKIAEKRREVLEGKLIPKKDVIRLLEKLHSINCPECSETIKLIIDNIATFRVS